MSNTIITPSIIAKEALLTLENNLVLGNLVHTDYSDEFTKVGSTVSIRRPVKYVANDGATLVVQDTTEGTTSVAIDKQKHVAMGFSAVDLTLSIEEFKARYIEPAMIELAQKVESDLAGLYRYVWNWVGTPGTTMGGMDDVYRAAQRFDEMAVPDMRNMTLSPADYYGMLAEIKGLYVQDKARTAIERAKLGMLGNMDTYKLQSASTHTCGTRDNTTPLTNGASQATTYAATRTTGTMSLICDGFDATATIKAGDVFTLGTTADGYLAVNPRTRTALPYLQQFVVQEDATCSGGAVTLTISPPIITSGAYQTVSAVGTAASTSDGHALTFAGTASTGYIQNLAFHKQAFALVTRPLEFLPGVPDQARESNGKVSVRLMPVADGINDVGRWRLDILYGVKCIYPDLACRVSG
jgi:hypothetical protein